MLAESLEARRLFADFGADTSWGQDGYLAPGGDVSLIGVAAGGLAVIEYGSSPTLARYRLDGAADGAYVESSIDLGRREIAVQTAVDAQGRVLLLTTGADGNGVVVRRFLAGGGVDTSFGGGAVSIAPPEAAGPEGLTAYGDIFLAGGQIFVTINVGGTTPSGTFAEYNFAYRLTDSGTIDPTYGNFAGRVEIPAQKFRVSQIDSQGRFYGSAYDAQGNVYLRRFLFEGTPDTTYGDSGQVFVGRNYNQPQDPYFYINYDAQGRALLTRVNSGANYVNRYTVDGQLDTAFGDGGNAALPDSFARGLNASVLIQDDGKYLVVNAFDAVRLTADGDPDRTFDGDGLATVSATGNSRVYGPVVAQLPDGNYLESRSFTFDGTTRLNVQRVGLLPSIIRDARGRLQIAGTDGNDVISARVVGDRVRIVFNGQTFDYAASRVRGLVVQLLGGNDAFDSDVSVGTAVYGGAGNDTIFTGAANDYVIAGAGRDSVVTGGGDDFVGGDEERSNTDSDDYYDLGTGNDNAADGYGNNTVLGGDGNDLLRTGYGNDSIVAGVGRDMVRSGPGDDDVDAGGSRDTVFGGDGNDTLNGGNQGDTLVGGLGDDRLIGNIGDDLILAGDPNAPRVPNARNRIEGGVGTDRYQLESDDDLLLDVETRIDVVT